MALSTSNPAIRSHHHDAHAHKEGQQEMKRGTQLAGRRTTQQPLYATTKSGAERPRAKGHEPLASPRRLTRYPDEIEEDGHRFPDR